MTRILQLICFTPLLLFACENPGRLSYSEEVVEEYSAPDRRSAKMSAPMEAPATMAIDMASPIQQSQVIPAEQQIIRTAHLRFQVKELNESTLAFQEAVRRFNAQVTSSNQTQDAGYLTTFMQIRVNHQQFDALVEELLKSSIYLNNKAINAQDVTEEYIDLNTRLRTRKALEARYLEILQQARTVEDIMKVEQQLSQVREQIESQEARLKYLKDQVQLSTIHLEAYQRTAYAAEPTIGFLDKLGQSIRNGWVFFVSFMLGMVSLWPFLLALVVALWFWRLWVKRRKAQRI
jgi:hypothetical protein